MLLSLTRRALPVARSSPLLSSYSLTPKARLQCVSTRLYSPMPRNIGRRPARSSITQQVLDDIEDTVEAPRSSGHGLSLLEQPMLVLERQVEFMSVALGFEQHNRYVVYTPNAQPVAEMQELNTGIINTILRQVYRLHRPFTVDVFDNYGNEVMRIQRGFSLINSHIKVIVNGEVIGESVQRWHLWRRRYDLFVNKGGQNGDEVFVQFGEIDSPFLAFEFRVKDDHGSIVANIDRNWVGLAREMFTDTGVYQVDMQQLGWRERAVLLANAVSIDFDYFSRHSGRGGVVGYVD